MASLRFPILATGLAMLTACGGGGQAPGPKTNVVLIVIDTLRADRLSCQGWDRPTSPTIDALAAGGARMALNHAQCSWTQPSMVSLMTGQYITQYRDVYPDGSAVIASTLRDAGYATIGVVSNTLVSSEAGFDRGFDHFDARRLTDEERQARAAAGGSPGPCREADEMLAELLGAVDEQRAADPDAPLFLYWHLMEPHAPYLPHTDLDATFPLRVDRPSEWHQGVYDAVAEVDQAAEDAGWQHINVGRTRYEREIRKADDAVAALLAALEERELREDTLVVIASDHGEGLWDHPTLIVPEEARHKPPHEFFHKEHAMFLHDEFVHTPLVFHGPGVPAGTVIEEATENVDVYPTLLQLLDLPSPGRLHGESLVPVWAGEPQRNTDAHAFVIHFGAIREGDTGLKLHVPSNAGAGVGARLQVYDTQSDRAEQHDLAAERAADAQRLHAKLTAWVEAYPTQSTLDRERTLAEKDDLQAMGYAGEDDERVNQKDE